MDHKKINVPLNEVKTQKTAIMRHFQDFGSITSLQASNEYGITRAAEYVRQLRREGYNIETINMTKTNRYGNSVTFAKYVYIDPDKNKDAIDIRFYERARGVLSKMNATTMLHTTSGNIIGVTIKHPLLDRITHVTTKKKMEETINTIEKRAMHYYGERQE